MSTKASSRTSRRFESRSETRGWRFGRRFVALVAVFALAGIADAAPTHDLRTGSFDPPRPAPEFTLAGSDGAPLKLGRYRGKVVALGFGYSSCADVCPTTLFLLAEAKKKLGPSAKDFQVIYITVDPERDTVPRLQKFLTAYDPTFVGGTGSREALGELHKAYGIQVSRQPPLNGDPNVYTIHHSSFVYLIDRRGNLRAMMPFGVGLDDVVHDVRSLLSQ